jgi:hypothetical protein
MGKGGSRATGHALATEELRAEISVKLFAAGDGKPMQRQTLAAAFRASDADSDGTV